MSGLFERVQRLLRRALGAPEPPPPGVPAAADVVSAVAGLDELSKCRRLSGPGRQVLAGAIGQAMAGLRTSAWLSGGDLPTDLLADAARRHLPLVLHVVGEVPGPHHGFVLLRPRSVQEAVDLTLAGRRVAEWALCPVVVAVDPRLLEAVQDLRLPEPEDVRASLGEATDLIDVADTTQRMLFGPQRRRVPRWHDLDHPLLSGARHRPAAAQAGEAVFFGETRRAALRAEVAPISQAPQGASKAKIVIVAAGSAIEVAEGVAERLRGTAVLGLRQLHPFPHELVGPALRGRQAIIVLGAELAGSLRESLLSALEAQLEPVPSMHVADYDELRAADLAALHAEVAAGRGRRHVQLGMPFDPGTSPLPKRQALLDGLRRDFPGLAERGLSGVEPLDVRPPRSTTVRRAGDPDALGGRLVFALLGGTLRATPEGFTWAPKGLRDPGLDPPVDVIAGPGAKALGSLIRGLCPEVSVRKAAKAYVDLGGTDEEAFKEGFESGEAATQVAAPPAPGAPTLPLAVQFLGEGGGTTIHSLPRFWDHIGVLERAGELDGVSPDPYLTAGALPPLSSTFRRAGVGAAPALDPTLCTGCGECWTACPDSAIAPLAMNLGGFVDAGISMAGAGALRRHRGKLVKRAHKAARSGPLRDLLAEPFAGLGADDASTAAFADLQAAIGDVKVAVTDPFFPEHGALLTLAVDPDACKRCGLCIAACEPKALALGADAAEARADWERWACLPDTPGATVEAMGEVVGPMAAALLSRHTALALGGGDTAEPGSGQRLGLRLVLASVERTLQPRQLGQRSQATALRARLAEQIKASLQATLPSDLDALSGGLAGLDAGDLDLEALAQRAGASGRVNTESLQWLVAAGRRLEALEAALTQGRARYSVALAPGEIAGWAATFPHNPFQVPVFAAETETPSAAVGLLEGQLSTATEAAGALRFAEAVLERPGDGPQAAADAASLHWRDLSLAERHALPPLLLVGDDALKGDLAGLSVLLRSDLPVKIIALCDPREGADFALLAMAHRGACVVQTTVAHPDHLAEGVRAALDHPGPALVCVGAPSPSREGFESDETLEVARRAVADRRFPLLRYLPDAQAFGLGLSLAGNPEEGEAAEPRAAEIWRTLRELAGVETPFGGRMRTEVEAAVAGERAEEQAGQRAEIAGLREAVEADLQQRLTERLMGLVGFAPGSEGGP